MASNIASLLVMQGLVYLLPLITLPYLTRVLSPQGFGLVAIATAIAQYGCIIVDWGFNLTATREIARNREDASLVTRVVWNTTAARALLALALLAVLLPAALLPALRPYTNLLVAAWLVAASGVLFPQFLFQGLERMGPITWINLAARLLTVSLVFLLINSPADYARAVYIQGAGGLVIGVLAWWVILRRRWVGWHRPAVREVAGVLGDSWPIFLSNAAVSLYTVSNALLLGAVAGSQSVGIFSAADRVRAAAQAAWAPVTQAVYPRVAALAGQGREPAMVFLRRFALWCVLFNGAVSIGMLVTAPWLVPLLFGQGYEHAVPVMMVLAAQPLLIGLSNLYGQQAMLSFGMQREFGRILVVSAVVNVVLLLVLGSCYQAVGAAAAVTTTELLVTVVMYAVLRRRGIVFWRGGRHER